MGIGDNKRPLFINLCDGAIGTFLTTYVDNNMPEDNIFIEYAPLGFIPTKARTSSIPKRNTIRIDSPYKEVKGVQSSYFVVFADSQDKADFFDEIVKGQNNLIKKLKEENMILKQRLARGQDVAEELTSETEKLMARKKEKEKAPLDPFIGNDRLNEEF